MLINKGNYWENTMDYSWLLESITMTGKENIPELKSRENNTLELSTPGIPKDALKITVEDGSWLKVAWVDRKGTERYTTRYLNKQRVIKASYQDGLLVITLEKESPPVTTIKID